MLVDIEYSSRKSNRLHRLIKKAEFYQPDANFMDIDYTSEHKLNRSLLNRLATSEYITEHRNLFITGATGRGKSYLAWKPASSTITPNMCDFLTFWLILVLSLATLYTRGYYNHRKLIINLIKVTLWSDADPTKMSRCLTRNLKYASSITACSCIILVFVSKITPIFYSLK